MMDATVFAYRELFRMTQLQGILLDIYNVYLLICKTGKQMPNNENAIRDALCDYLQNDNYKNNYTDVVRCYHVDTEAREGEHGRTDIRFLKVKDYEGQQVYYTIECKRLDGGSHLCKEYVENGIRRFTIGKYPTYLGCNAMLGFIVCAIDLGETVRRVNGYLDATEHLKTQSTAISSMVRLESQHTASRRFMLYHLWTDFSGLLM
jgi:hypothetical protein